MIILKAGGSDTVYTELKRLIRLNGLEQKVAVRPAGADGGCGILIADDRGSGCARALITAQDDESSAPGCADALAVVTVGLGPRNTVTPSSLLHEGGMATLQRELVSLGGEIVGPRDIDLTHLKGSIIEKMSIAAAMLVLSADAKW